MVVEGLPQVDVGGESGRVDGVGGGDGELSGDGGESRVDPSSCSSSSLLFLDKRGVDV